MFKLRKLGRFEQGLRLAKVVLQGPENRIERFGIEGLRVLHIGRLWVGLFACRVDFHLIWLVENKSQRETSF